MINKNSILKLENINKKFGELTVADNINLQFNGGEIYALIGPNGAGKTTLLNMINGFLKPDSGKIFLIDRNITGLPSYKIAKMGVGRLFQNIRTFGKINVMDNILIGENFKGEENPIASILSSKESRSKKKDVIEEIERLMKELNLPIKEIGKLASRMSFGQQKLISFGRLLRSDFDVLLLDEPVAGVQQAVKNIIYEKLIELKSKGKLVLIVEHEMEAVRKISDTAIFMDEGRVMKTGIPGEVLGDKEVIKTYINMKEFNQIKIKKIRAGEKNKELLLRVEDIHASYSKNNEAGIKNRITDDVIESGRNVLNGVNIELRKGETVSLLGPNGAGKSTLLKVLSGVIKPKMGSIYYRAEEGLVNITSTGIINRINMGISYFMQGGEIFPDFKVKENLKMPILKFSNNEINERISTVIHIFPELKEIWDKEARFLSGGERHILALGMTLIRKPKLLIYLDEPVAGLSPSLSDDILSRIEDLKDNMGMSIFIVEQKLGKALSISDRVYIMKNGKIDRETTSDKITKEEIESIYFGTGIDVILSDYRFSSDRQFYPLIDYLRKQVAKDDIPLLISLAKEKKGSKSRLAISLLRKFKGDKEVKSCLEEIWKNSGEFQYKIAAAFELLEYPGIEIDFHKEVFNFIMKNLEKWKKRIVNWNIKDDRVLKYVEERMSDPGRPSEKKWIYVCASVASPDIEPVVKFLKKYKNSKDNMIREVSEQLLKFLNR